LPNKFAYDQTTLHVPLLVRIPVVKHQSILLFQQIVSYNPQKDMATLSTSKLVYCNNKCKWKLSINPYQYRYKLSQPKKFLKFPTLITYNLLGATALSFISEYILFLSLWSQRNFAIYCFTSLI